MAVWSEIKSPQIKGAFNILAEHYQQERLAAEETLRKNSQKTIGDLFFESTKTISSNLINDNFIVYDLTDSLGNFFGQGKNTKDFVVSSNKKYAEEADFLISRLRYYLLEMAILPKREHTTVVSTEYLIFRSKNDISTHFLLPFCLSKPVQSILKWAQTGNEHPRFSSDELKRINIPDLLLHNANKITTLVEKAIQSNDDSQSLYTQAQQLLEQELGLDKLSFVKPVGYEAQFSEAAVSARFDSEHYFPEFNSFINNLPKRIKLVPLAQLLNFCQRGKQPIYSKSGARVINSKHILNNKIVTEGNRYAKLNPVAQFNISHGDTLINGTGRV